ncbi:hypothetical protein [Lysinibacillus pakistanensis]|uniref:Uncharacterized protein n=1 Tax=Lysinibacillus pakistanensis TaxID=759811 RepID=A0AAX3WR73_9BACI|nr:hypothetical protein [Lysinibacillus pakistanensis]MDM5229671.1 hypothetical protein [Lysinibacillus pakistanensis]WHY45289.1 hypothetical protein QNH22_18500 [Lysinibacillus pakistanensis]WHY50297.1 hypothetical protein QNH24_18465 [Lysinibacillus pakistanensis]
MKKELIKLIENFNGEITQEHLSIVKLSLSINNPKALMALQTLSKSIHKKSNSL